MDVGTIRKLQSEIHNTAVAKGWWEKPRDMGEILANIHSEVSEAWECYRNNPQLLDLVYYEDGSRKPLGFPTELADIIIRTLDLAAHLGIVMDNVILEKMVYNRTRPYRHGGKAA